MNLLYLHHQHGETAGRDRFAGNRLYSRLRANAEGAVTAHMIVNDDDLQGSAPSFRDDVVSGSEVLSEGFDTIYCEGGPRSSFSNDSSWVPKIPYPFAEKFVRQGGIIFFSDVGVNFARNPDDSFCGLTSAWFSESAGEPVYFVDNSNRPDYLQMEIDLAELKPRVAEWLQPAFERPNRLIVSNAVELRGFQSALLFPTQRSVGTLCQDCWWSAPHEGVDHLKLRYHPSGPQRPDLVGPFACVRQLGYGFFVTIAAIVSPDRLAENQGGAGLFVSDLVNHLGGLVKEQKETAGFQRFRELRLFLSHRSIDKPIVEEVAKALKLGGVRTWFDKDRLIPSDSLGLSIDGGLQDSTHFVLFWSANCPDAPWIEFELGAALKEKKPIFIVTLDDTPIPPALRQFLRVCGRTPNGIASALVEALERLADRRHRLGSK